MKRAHLILTVAGILLVLNAGCTSFLGGQVAQLPGEPGITQTSEVPVIIPQPTTPALPQVEPTPTVPPTLTPAPTHTPTAVPTATPTLHPMSIERQRQEAYPGSEIVIEQTLDPGANYYRYIASYLSEGLKIYALLTVPYGEMPESGWPAIVFNHGYIPPAQYRTTERYIAYVDGFARNGYIVFRIDYRGHDRSEGAATGAYGHPGYTHDVLNAVTALQRFPQADPERIGMWGHSMGGFLTLRAMVISPDVKAGVIWAGVVAPYPDMLSRWRRTTGTVPTPPPTGTRSWRAEWTELYGSPEANPEFWSSVSANTYVSDLSGPVQIHHGTADQSVPLEFSEILHQQIVQAGRPVEFYSYPGDDHNLSSYFTQAMQRSIQFFDTHLKQ